MEMEHLLENYSPAADMASFFICITLLFLIRSVLFFSKDEKFSYLKKALHFVMFGAVFNIAFYQVAYYFPQIEALIISIRAAYHIMLTCCMYLFLLYVKEMMSIKNKIVKAVTMATRILCLVAVLFDVLSPFTKFGLHKEGDLWYDPIISPYNLFYAYGVILLFFMLMMYSNRMIRPIRNCLIVTEIIVIIIMTKSGLDNTNTMTCVTYLLPIIVMMILLHSKPFDDKTGALGIDNFDSFIKQVSKKQSCFDYMILKLDMNGINRIPDELGKVLNSFWHNSFRNAELFRVEHDLFVLVIPRTSRNGNTEIKIRGLMDYDFLRYYSIYQLKYKVIGLFDIDFINSEKDIKNILSYMLLTMNDNEMVIADENMRNQLRLLHSVMDHLEDIASKEDLQDERVLVYCQPIRNMKTGKYDTAEALMRMTLPETGFIMPYMFIPLAESYGLIHSLTKIMLNKVCLQIKELDQEGYQFERISVNFAASEIKSVNFCTEVLEIISSNGIDPSRIGIEITETQNEGDFAIVKDKMKILRDAGMTLYLDDVGTGYSNLDRIVRYDVDVVKFDRFFLMEAEKDDKVEKMMKHLAEAFKEMNYSLLYEGVENTENEELCLKCGADYIQGFMYSKPVPMEELRGFFSK